MKTIMITAPSSGSGKTTVTMGIIRALKNMGLDITCFKTGPDYIDTAFLKAASGKDAGNLDMHLQGNEGIKESLSLATAEYCVIEGAMGYFDGIYNTYRNSSYEISKVIGVNSILIYTPKGEMFTAIPKIKGMCEFEGSTIKGIILNKVNKHTFSLLKEQIEKYTSLKVLGFVPEISDIELKSRHLGLIQSMEIEDLDKKIERAAEVILANLDINELIQLMSDIKTESDVTLRRHDIKVAIARDSAFSFYYRENLWLFEKSCDVIYFSPLIDEKIPDCDLLYLGGGYPEVFREELSKNTSMIKSIEDFAENGGCIYAECGGFMYLTEFIEDSRMVGILKGTSIMTNKLQRFGYIDITLNHDCMIGSAGDFITAHEFHKSQSHVEGHAVYNIKKTMGEKTWECGHAYKNVLAGYPHINFLGNMKAFYSLIDYVKKVKVNNQLFVRH
jgi:cobyrinic acid a,c-diamide synthase